MSHVQGFDTHIKEDHNMWAYVYYAYYLDSIDTNNHTAIQKYVFNLVSLTMHIAFLILTTLAISVIYRC